MFYKYTNTGRGNYDRSEQSLTKAYQSVRANGIILFILVRRFDWLSLIASVVYFNA